MENDSHDVMIQAVEGFQDQNDDNQNTGWNDELEQFISHIARTGDTLVSWDKVRKVFMHKLQLVLDEFYQLYPYTAGKANANATNDDFDEMKKRLLKLTEDFDGPPFTIQRLCELLSEPMKNYTKCEKFMRGLEKNLMVVTSWNYTTRRASFGNETILNGGVVGASNGFATSDRPKPHWANLPPSPVATGPPKIQGAPDFTDTSPSKDLKTEDVGEEGVTTKPDLSLVQEDLSKKMEDDQEEEEDSEKKSNISATIISSSPPTTINIKRKIDESSEGNCEELTDPIIAESPTKKMKSDTADDKTETAEAVHSEQPENPDKSADEISDKNSTPAEMGTDDTKEIEKVEIQSCEDESPQDPHDTQSSTPTSKDDGSSVDPSPSSEEDRMDVD